jgi:hypothetical protein
VQEAAVLVRLMLQQLGLDCWLKTSGGKGLHVVVPPAERLEYETVKAFSQTVVQHMARTILSRFIAKSGPKNRVGKRSSTTCATGTAPPPQRRSRRGRGRAWVSPFPLPGSCSVG